MENQVKKEDSKQKKKSVIMPILLIAGSILVAYFMSGVGPAPEKYEIDEKILSRIDSLERVNNELKAENIKLDSLISEYRLRIDDLDWNIAKIVEARKADQKKFHDRAEEARAVNDDSVYNFFKDRYNF
jgi:hypothetical protein